MIAGLRKFPSPSVRRRLAITMCIAAKDERHRMRLAMLKAILFLLLGLTEFAAIAVTNPLPALTIITHGFVPTGGINVPAWVNYMADSIQTRTGATGRIYRLWYNKQSAGTHADDEVFLCTTSSGPCTKDNGPIDITIDGGAIVLLDWAAASNETFEYLTQEVADRFYDRLFGMPPNGYNLARLPIHLIGHSRGGSLNSRLVQRLAIDGIVVDHVTTLDPHPVTAVNAIGAEDLNPTTYQNVVFADNYYRTGAPFEGQSVFGALNSNLSNTIGGNGLCTEHEQVHTYFHGTIDTLAATVDGCAIQDIWYQQSAARNQTGYNFSRFTNRSLARPALGLNALIGAANSVGSGLRTNVSGGDALWPNVVFDQRAIWPTRVTVGQALNIPYWFVDRNSQLTIAFFRDDDTNPFNGSFPFSQLDEIGVVTQNIRPQGTIGAATFTWTPTAADVGTHYIGAKASNSLADFTRVRYDYYLQPIIVDPAPISLSAPTIGIVSPGNGVATVNFTPPLSGSVPTSYTARCSASGQATRTNNGASSPIDVISLANGTTYSCDVIANKSQVSGPPSASVSVTPVAPGAGTTMSPPTNLQAVISGTGANFTWAAPTSGGVVSQFRIYRNGVFTAIVQAPFTNFFNGGVAASPGTYVYGVEACNANSVCSSRPTVTLTVAGPTDAQKPTSPIGSASPISGIQIALSWTTATDNVGVSKYLLFRNSTLVATLGNSATSYVDSGLTASTSYTYYVLAGDAAGNLSDPIPFTGITLASVVLDQIPPAKPTGLAAVSVSGSQINLSWSATTDNVGVSNYRVFRGTQIIATLGNVLAYSDSGLTANANYTYYVQASDAAGNWSDLSLPATAGTFVIVPVPLSVTKISGGSGHTLGVKSNGTVWAWGTNYLGMLGTNNTSSSNIPVQTIVLTSVSAVAAGAQHSLALRTDRTVWAWGQNAHGQLGNGNVNDSLTPIQVSGISTAVAIAGGTEYSAALKADNTVWAWGKNSYGQLGACGSCAFGGDGAPYSATPIQVFSNAVKIALGIFHTLAIKTDGTVWVWGTGNGITSTPTAVAGLSNVTDIAGGAGFSAALSGGFVWTWGNNGSGQLGNGNAISTTTPQKILGLPPIVAISAGFAHTLVLGSDGTVWTWGYNSNGLGVSNITISATPIQVTGMAGVTAVAAGAYFNALLRSDGTCWVWGDNGNGQFGDGTSVSSFGNGNPWGTPIQSKFNTGLLSSITIVGAGSIAESSSARYTVFATYDNGSTNKINGTFSLGTTPAATLSDGNLLSGSPVSSDQVVTLSATYSEGATTRTATLPVTIKNIAAAPASPTQVTAAPGIGQVIVSFMPPASDGGSSITSYTATSIPGGITATGPGSPITVTGLSFGTSYSFKVAATNSIGTGSDSLLSSPVSTISVPNAPSAIVAVAGNAQATVTFAAPVDGGSAITGYTVVSNPPNGGDANAGSLATTHTILGLVNGTAYTFTVTATNTIGASQVSAPSNTVTPTSAPNPPSNVIAVSGNAQATVAFSAPSFNGGSAITGYSVTSNPSGGVDLNAGSAGLSHVISGLTNGTTYSFTVVANNATGPSSASPSSNTITPATTPGSPTGVVATPGPGSVLVSFSAPTSNGGLAITSYTVVCGSQSATSSELAVSVIGLTDGVAVTCMVVASNAVGSSVPSSQSNSVVPGLLGLVRVVSRKTHTGAGIFDLPLTTNVPITGTVTVEPRATGTGHVVVFQFDKPISVIGAVSAVDNSGNMVSITPTFGNNEVLVGINGIANGKRVTISLSGVNGTTDKPVSLGFLLGDVNGTRTVDLTDARAVRARAGQVVDSSNFLYDINLTGVITGSDISAVKARGGTTLP